MAIIMIVIFILLTILAMVLFVQPLMLSGIVSKQLVALITMIFMLISDIECGIMLKYIIIAYNKNRS